MNVWRRAAELARAGVPGALATVARTTGSTPVPAGSKMVIGAAGRLEGTVGGGCVEADVIGGAADALARRAPIIQTHHLNADLAGDLGLSCGGTVDVVVEPLVNVDSYVRVLEAAAAAAAGVVTTGLDWAGGPVKTFTAEAGAGVTGGPVAPRAPRPLLIARPTPAPPRVAFCRRPFRGPDCPG